MDDSFANPVESRSNPAMLKTKRKHARASCADPRSVGLHSSCDVIQKLGVEDDDREPGILTELGTDPR